MRWFPAITLFLLIAVLALVPTPLPAQDDAEATTPVAAIAKVQPSLVAIGRVRRDAATPPRIQAQRFPRDDYPLHSGPVQAGVLPHEFGVGVVIDSQGLILTSLHALGEIDSSDYFVWANRRVFAAKVKAADPWLDVAVLQIAATDLIPIEFGDASQIKMGEPVIALGGAIEIARDGEALDEESLIVRLACEAPTTAVARSREGFELGSMRRDTLHHYGTLLQFNALSPSSSGGVLINRRGEMIGQTTTYAASADDLVDAHLAIPVDADFLKSLATLKTGRLPEYGFLGIVLPTDPLDPRRRGKSGALVEDVVPGAPAARAGLRAGDLITRLEGHLVSDDLHLIRLVSALPAQAKIKLEVLREPGITKPLSVVVELSKKYQESARQSFAEVREPAWRGMRVEYATASPLYRELSQHVDPEGCVAVLEVERDSLAWKAGLRGGLFVSHVNEKRVSTPQQFAAQVERFASDEVALRITNALDDVPVRKVAAP